MKYALLLLSLLCAAAQATTPIDARTLSGACTLTLKGNDSAGIASFCRFAVVGFVDGYRKGIERGLSSALIYDKAASETVQGIRDLQMRISALRPQAVCIPVQTSYEDIIQVYVRYMDNHKDQLSDPYAGTLRDAIEDAFPCQ